VSSATERARLEEAARFATCVRAHPAYRAYERLRRFARQLGGNGRA